MKVSLRKALQIKNKLTGDFAKVESKIRTYNSTDDATVKRFDMKELLSERATLLSKLVEVKTQIAKANIGIYETITMLAECKASIKFYESLNTKEGNFKDGYGDTTAITTYTAYINAKSQNDLVKELNDQIEKLQDKIDHYNITTEIVLSD